MELKELNKLKGVKKSKKRRGRGAGSGKGFHTSGSGHKGQKARTGNSLPFGFEGGQVPLYKKLPKIGGFKNHHRKDIKAINILDLNRFEKGATVRPEDLVNRGVLKSLPRNGVKILGNGKIEKKLTLNGFLYSEAAREKLEKAGCVIE